MNTNELSWHEADTLRRRVARVLNAFLPQTLEERLSKLQDRMATAWPEFGRSGLYDRLAILDLTQHESGTVVRFFNCDEDQPTFDPVGAVKHGAYWWLSAEINGVGKMSNKEMQQYLRTNKLNWVIIK